MELSSLVYQLLEGDIAQQTSYILQFLWRDLTSDFDIIGPYFTYHKTMEQVCTFMRPRNNKVVSITQP